MVGGVKPPRESAGALGCCLKIPLQLEKNGKEERNSYRDEKHSDDLSVFFWHTFLIPFSKVFFGPVTQPTQLRG